MAAHAPVDYYATLQVPKHATQDDIRAAYKQRAIALHPDKNAEVGATKDFQRLVEAYSVLKDPQKRQQYDTRGQHDDEDEFYSDDEEYEDDGVQCNCPFHHHHHGASFSSVFEELFARHYSQYGYRGFFDEDGDDLDDRYQGNFFKKYSSKPNGRFAADWSTFPSFPSTTELKTMEVPDRPSKPKALLAGNKIKLEWAKRTPRKRVNKWHLSYSIDNGVWIENPFGAEDKSYEFSGVVPGTSYGFKVAASSASGMSEWSEVTTVVVPGGAAKKVEDKVAAPAPRPKAKKKSKKKADPDSKRSKLVSELEEAISDRDKVRLEKAVTAAKKEVDSSAANPSTDREELVSFLHQAQAELRSINREAERQGLIAKLKAAAKGGDGDQFWTLEEKLRDVMKKETDDEEIVAAVDAEIEAAREVLDAQAAKQAERDSASNEVQEAMDAEDIERLTTAIDEAARLSLPTKEARKKLKALQAALEVLEEDQEQEQEQELVEEAAHEETGQQGEGEEAEEEPEPAVVPAKPAAEQAEDDELRLAMELSRKEYEAEEKLRRQRNPVELQKQHDEANAKRKKGGANVAAETPAAAQSEQRNDPHSNPPCKNLWVGNLSWKVSEEHIRQSFGKFGQIESIKILPAKHCCFVNFRNEAEAVKARSTMFGELLLDRPLHIYFGRDETKPPNPNAPRTNGPPTVGRAATTATVAKIPPPIVKSGAAVVAGTTTAPVAALVTAVVPVTAQSTPAAAPVTSTSAAAPSHMSATAKKAAAQAKSKHAASPAPVPVAIIAPVVTQAAAAMVPIPAPVSAATMPARAAPPITELNGEKANARVVPHKGPAQRQHPIAPISKPVVPIATPGPFVTHAPLHTVAAPGKEHIVGGRLPMQPMYSAYPAYVMPSADGASLHAYPGFAGFPMVPLQPQQQHHHSGSVGARSAAATLSQYAVAHAPPLVMPAGYYMTPAGYPSWPPAQDAHSQDQLGQDDLELAPEEEDILMQRFGGWN